jgi:hypothetical protein
VVLSGSVWGQYCASSGNNPYRITNVNIGSIDNRSGNGGGGYEDFTALSYNVQPGLDYSLNVEVNTVGNNRFWVSVFIDWNQDQNFTADEYVELGQMRNSTGNDGKVISGTISVPAGAVTGQTRMRVINSYWSYHTDACADPFYGQTEDYTVNVLSLEIDNIFYSYQSGNWSDNKTWTLDPSGTVWIDGGTPGVNDHVVILNGRQVDIGNNAKTIYSIEIEKGAVLDLRNTQNHTFGNISGSGYIKLASSDFPAGIPDAFMQTGGGTVEYYNTGNFTFDNQVTEYNNLIINLTDPNRLARLQFDMRINGELKVNQGILSMENNSPLNLEVYGGFKIEQQGQYTYTGPQNFNTTNPRRKHRIELYGDFVNNGIAHFYDQTNTDYTGTSTRGRVHVAFLNSTKDQNVVINGETRFYRIEIDKGVDDTYILNIDASNTGLFSLLGANNFNMNNTPPNMVNDNSLGLLAGTVRLGENIVIPKLFTGGSDVYNIDSDAQLWIDGADVTFCEQDDDVSALIVYNKFRLTRGRLQSRSDQGIILRSSGQILIDGGTLDANVIRTSSIAGVHRGTIRITNGEVHLRGNRWMTGLTMYGTLSLPYSDNTFYMSGGELTVHDPTYYNPGGDGQYFSILMNAKAENIQITGGTVNIVVPDNMNAYFNTPSPFWNLNILGNNSYECRMQAYAGNGTMSISSMPIRDIVVKNNLHIQSSSLNANNADVYVGNNFTIDGDYNPGTNSTYFNGTSLGQKFNINGSITGNLNNLYLTNTSFTEINNSITVNGDLQLNSGTQLNDAGNTINLYGDLLASGEHFSQGAGNIRFVSGTSQSINGDGNGLLGNIILNKTGGEVTLNSPVKINGNLRLVSNTIFDISTKNLILSEKSKVYDNLTGTGQNFSTTKMIRLAGASSDQGVTQSLLNTDNFFLPLGVGAKYTPVSIFVNADLAERIDLAYRPVNNKPATITEPNSLNYYWRVNRVNSAVIPNGQVTYEFFYNNSDEVGDASTYVPALFQSGAWNTINNIALVKEADDQIIFTPLDSPIGLFTCGVPGAFTDVYTYYSRKNGDWDDMDTWSIDPVNKWNGPALSASDGLPNASAPVVIGNGSDIDHTITASTNGRAAAFLYVNEGSVLDLGTTTGNGFSIVSALDGLNKGKIQMSSAGTDVSDMFPNGDWGEFLGPNGGEVEYYTSGSRYNIPNTGYPTNSENEYYNLTITTDDAGGSRLQLRNLDYLVHNDLVKGGAYDFRFSNAGSNDLTVKNDLIVEDGQALFNTDGITNLHVVNNTRISNTGGLVIRSGSNVNHTYIVEGDIENNGVFDMEDGRYVHVTFEGEKHSDVIGTGTRTEFYQLTVDKGIDTTYIVDVNSSNFSLTNTNQNIFIENGTFRLTSAQNLNISRNTSYQIPATGRLSANGGVLNIGAQDNDGDVDLFGVIEVLNGEINVGQDGYTSNNDIIYGATGKPSVIIKGGSLNVNGQIRRPSAVSMGALNYIQKDGFVNIRGVNAWNGGDGLYHRAKLEVLNLGSRFAMEGGELHIFRGRGTDFGDLYLNPDTYEVNGGKIILGNTSTPAADDDFKVYANCPIWDLEINSDTRTKSAELSTFNLEAHSLIITGNSVFNAKGFNVSLSGNLVNENTSIQIGLDVGGYRAGLSTQVTEFNGSLDQSIVGSSNKTNLANLKVNTTGGAVLSLSANTDVHVNNDLDIRSGILDDGGNTIHLLGNVYNGGIHRSSGSGKLLFEGSSRQEITGSNTGEFGAIEVDNLNKVNMVSDNTVNNSITLTNGSFRINEYQLTLSETAVINGTISDDTQIETNGTLSDFGIKKKFTGAAGSFLYPFGVISKNTPVNVSYTGATTDGYVRIRPVNMEHPTLNTASGDELNYYWAVETNGLTSASYDLDLNYKDTDVDGTETDFIEAKYNSYSWTKYNAVDVVNHKIDLTAQTDINGEFTAGHPDNFVDLPILYSVSSGNWHSGATWTQNSDHSADGSNVVPEGHPVVIAAGHDITMNGDGGYSYSIELYGSLDIAQTVFHNLGFIKGDGTFKIEASPSEYFVFPGGDFTEFMNTTGSTIEFSGTGTMPETRVYQNITFTGGGNIKLANNGFTALGNVLITGNTTLDNAGFYREIFVKKDWTTEGSSKFNAGTGRVTFNGVAQQNINLATSQTFYNLAITNAAGVNVNTSVLEVEGNLELNSGILTTSATSPVYISNTSVGAIVGGGSSSYVDGPLQKEIAINSYFDFPIGNNGRYGKARVFNTSPSVATWESQYYNQNPDVGGMDHSLFESPLESISDNEYWRVEGPAGGNADVEIRWDDASGNIPDNAGDRLTKMRMAFWNGSAWELAGQSVTDLGKTSGYVASSGGIDLDEKYFTLSVENLPTATITTASHEICNDGTSVTIPVQFTGTAPYIFKYTINGAESSAITSNSTSFNLVLAATDLDASGTAGDYIIKISSITDATGSAGVKDFTTSVTIKIKETPSPSIIGKVQANFNESGVVYKTGLSTLAGHTYTWVITSGSITLPSPYTNSNSIEVTWDASGAANPGIVELTETIDATGCSMTDQIDVTLSVMPTPSVTGNTQPCIGEIYTYRTAASVTNQFKWSVSPDGEIIGNIDNRDSVQVRWTTLADKEVKVEETADGNTASSTLSVNVKALPSDAYVVNSSTNICEGDDIEVTVVGLPGGLSLQVFDASTDNAVSGVENSGGGGDVVITYTGTGNGAKEYYVLVSNEYGCDVELTDRINVNISPTFTPTITAASTTHCGLKDDSFSVSVTPADTYAYSWTVEDGSIDDDTKASVIINWLNPNVVSVSREITVKVSKGGCSKTVISNVTVVRTPETGPTYHLENN